jgi:hypothetical protein
MKHIKLFEDFVLNNQEGDLISYQDILDCIRKRGLIYADIILGFPDNDPSLLLPFNTPGLVVPDTGVEFANCVAIP